MYYIIIWIVCYLFLLLLVDIYILDIEEFDKCCFGYIGKYCSELMCDVVIGCGVVDRGMILYVYDEIVCFILFFLIYL